VAYAARIFPVAEYGKFNYALGIVSFLIILADLGISSIATREIAKDVNNEKRYLGPLFSLKLVLSIATFLLAMVIAPIANPEPRVQHVIWLVAAYLLSSQFTGVFYALFRRAKKWNTKPLETWLRLFFIAVWDLQLLIAILLFSRWGRFICLALLLRFW